MDEFWEWANGAWQTFGENNPAGFSSAASDYPDSAFTTTVLKTGDTASKVVDAIDNFLPSQNKLMVELAIFAVILVLLLFLVGKVEAL